MGKLKDGKSGHRLQTIYSASQPKRARQTNGNRIIGPKKTQDKSVFGSQPAEISADLGENSNISYDL